MRAFWWAKTCSIRARTAARRAVGPAGRPGHRPPPWAPGTVDAARHAVLGEPRPRSRRTDMRCRPRRRGPCWRAGSSPSRRAEPPSWRAASVTTWRRISPCMRSIETCGLVAEQGHREGGRLGAIGARLALGALQLSSARRRPSWRALAGFSGQISAARRPSLIWAFSPSVTRPPGRSDEGSVDDLPAPAAGSPPP